MLISNKQSVEDLIVEILAKNPYLQGPILLEKVNIGRSKTTKQAMYTALSNLLLNEIVAKAGDKYFLSQLWLQKLNRLFDLKKQVSEKRDAIFDLEEGESISYHFPSLLSCDTYWAHIYSILTDWISKNKGIFMWEPHHWFILGRENVEKEILNDYTRKKVHAFFAVQGNTALDQRFKKDWRSDFVSINTGDKNTFNSNYYLHIFDDFIIEVFLDKRLTEKIDEFYKTTSELSGEKKIEFENLISEKYPVRMKISKNKSKSAILCKKLSKDFYLPLEIKM